MRHDDLANNVRTDAANVEREGDQMVVQNDRIQGKIDCDHTPCKGYRDEIEKGVVPGPLGLRDLIAVLDHVDTAKESLSMASCS